jgi:hypothetical protein
MLHRLYGNALPLVNEKSSMREAIWSDLRQDLCALVAHRTDGHLSSLEFLSVTTLTPSRGLDVRRTGRLRFRATGANRARQREAMEVCP